MVGRGNSAAFDAEVDNDTISPRLLVKAVFASGTIYVWNGIGDISWDSQTWVGIGTLLSIDNVEEGVDLRPNSVTLSLTGVPAAYKSLALSDIRLSNVVDIWFALLDANGAVIVDPDKVFRGYMDEVEFVESPVTCDFRVSIINRLVEMEKVKERRYTEYDQKEIYSTDTGLRHIVNVNRDTPWGSDVT